MLPQDAFGRKKHDLKTGRGPDALHPVSRFAVEQASVDVSSRQMCCRPLLKDHQKNRITTGPLLSDTAVRISGVPGSAAAQITAGVYRAEL